MGPGKKVLYLGAASGTTVSHVSDIVGPVSFLFFVRTDVTLIRALNQRDYLVIIRDNFCRAHLRVSET